MEEAKKRRAHTSNEVKLKYNQKTYAQYGIKLRIVEDAIVIQKIEEEKLRVSQQVKLLKD